MTSSTDANCVGAGVCRISTTKDKKIYQNLGLVKYQQLEYDMVSKAVILKYRQDDKGIMFFDLLICLFIAGPVPSPGIDMLHNIPLFRCEWLMGGGW